MIALKCLIFVDSVLSGQMENVEMLFVDCFKYGKCGIFCVFIFRVSFMFIFRVSFMSEPSGFNDSLGLLDYEPEEVDQINNDRGDSILDEDDETNSN